MRIVPSLVVALAASGCATPYQPDLAGKPSASVRMVSTHAMGARAAVLSGACVPSSTIGWDRNAQQLAYLPGRGREPERSSLGMPAAADLPEYASFSEHRIAAGEPTMLAFYGTSFEGNRTVTCAIATRFTPVDGANYEVRYGEQSGGICTITASRLMEGPAGRVVPLPIETAQRVPRC